jgi:hypothetical protein
MSCILHCGPTETKRRRSRNRIDAEQPPVSIETSLRIFFHSDHWTIVHKDLPRLAARTHVIAYDVAQPYIALPDEHNPESHPVARALSIVASSAAELSDAQAEELARSRQAVIDAAKHTSMLHLCKLVWDVSQYVESGERVKEIHTQLLDMLAHPQSHTADLQATTLFIINEVRS